MSIAVGRVRLGSPIANAKIPAPGLGCGATADDLAGDHLAQQGHQGRPFVRLTLVPAGEGAGLTPAGSADPSGAAGAGIRNAAAFVRLGPG
jgi:hypothetical protein